MSVVINGEEITFNLKESIPIERQINLIDLTIQESYVDGILNPMLLDVLFPVNLILACTDSDLTLEQRMDKFELYDSFKQANLFEEFEMEMETNFPGTLDFLEESLAAWSDEFIVYHSSFSGFLDSLKIFIGDIAEKTNMSLANFKDLDPNLLAQVGPLAQALGINFTKKAEAQTPTE